MYFRSKYMHKNHFFNVEIQPTFKKENYLLLIQIFGINEFDNICVEHSYTDTSTVKKLETKKIY